MNNDRLEQELRTYFRCEAEAAAPPQDWWQSAVSRATASVQPSNPKTGLAAWIRNLLDILRINPQRPFWGMATTVVVLLMLVVVSYGAGVVISNFPAFVGAPPTVIPPGTTGIPPTATGGGTVVTPTITVAIPEASPPYLVIFFAVLILLVVITFSILILTRKSNGPSK